MALLTAFKLAARFALRDWRAGELKILAFALVVATASVTTVAFFSDRVSRALALNASKLIGADLRVSSDRPLSDEFRARAASQQLSTVATLRFPSMILSGGESGLLADVQAVEEGYPLRGEIKLLDGSNANGVPVRGQVWPDSKLASRLKIVPGDTVALGDASFKVGAIVKEEPESAVGFFNLGPRLFMNVEDVPATGLVQIGSRIRYSLLVAGDENEVAAFRNFAEARLDRGQHIQDVRGARPEIKAALERAERFLGLAALSSVILAAAAIALAARRYVQRHLDACAMMRCVGASQSLIVTLYLEQFVIFGVIASAVGCVIGVLAQHALALILAPLVASALPAPGVIPAIKGFAAGFLLLIGFALPPLLALKRVPALRVLRRELRLDTGIMGYALGVALVVAAIVWQANDLTLAAYVLAGMAGIIVASALVALAFFALTKALKTSGLGWRYGFVSLRRRKLGSIVQISALGLGVMALLTLTLVRDDLLRNWKETLPPETPNRFLVNIQPEQLAPLNDFFASHGLSPPQFFPMVRGRLIAINDRSVSSEEYADERAKRLVDREFNLSWAERLQPDNIVIAGDWRSANQAAAFSVEQGIAEALGIRLGDKLTFDIGGIKTAAEVTSLRKVDWDSFRVNFFVIAEPGLLENFPASFVTSFYLSAQQSRLISELAREFTNILVIDVEAILSSVQEMIRQVRHAVEFVFIFTMLAGLAVLYAAITLTAEERNREAALLRALGAAGAELRTSLVTEFAALGALAGVVGAFGASTLTYILATRVFNLPFTMNYWLWVAGVVAGAIVVAAAGIIGTRAVLKAPPGIALRAAE
jgi:putative ABC transport system permease protein